VGEEVAEEGMRPSDTLSLSMRQLKERKLRSVLTVLAIAVGVTSIIALSAQVEGVKEGITRSLEVLGPDTIMVTLQSGMIFTDADVARVRGLEGVSSVTPMMAISVKVSGIEDRVSLIGISSYDLAGYLGEIRLFDGTIYYDVPAPQAVIGYNIGIDEAGDLRYKAGQPILITIGKRTLSMTVVGVLDEYGTLSAIQPDNSVFMPVDYVKALLRRGGYTLMMVKAENSEDVEQIVDLIEQVFGGRARVMSVKQLTSTVISITSQLNLLLLGIAGTSFIAAGLGTFNIMMISVLERVREIGILKAVGMKDKGILFLYITQGLLLGLFGSIVGLILGSITAYTIPIILEGGFGLGFGRAPRTGLGQPRAGQTPGMIPSYTPVISLTYLSIAIAVSIIVTLVSTAYPAWKASKLSPVEALRHE